jgi:hypothetical protein
LLTHIALLVEIAILEKGHPLKKNMKSVASSTHEIPDLVPVLAELHGIHMRP